MNDLLNHTKPETPDFATQIKRYLLNSSLFLGGPANNGGAFWLMTVAV